LLLLKIKTFARLYKQTKELNDIKLNLEQKVEARTTELIQANKELETSNAELQQYAFIASHDLQEPLRKIITFSQIVKERFSNGTESTQYVNRIITSAERMRTLINDLLSYSKLAVTPAFVNMPLNLVVQDTLTDLELIIKETNANVVVEKLPAMEIIPDQVRQLFQNIISNAIKFSKKNMAPEIKIWSDLTNEKSAKGKPVADGSYCRIYISDKGIGFNEQYLDKIFTMFQRLHGRAEYEGTGIGLSIVKKIVEKHNGIVTARSKEGEGTTFIIILPLKQTGKPLTGLHK
jgi:light-regulated signal transduction histidine kinase (bacteriophytochrome)